MAGNPLKTRRGYLALICIVLILGVVFFTVDRRAVLEWLAQQQANAIAYTEAHLVKAIAIAFVVYVLVTASGFPGSTALSVVQQQSFLTGPAS